jgi:geranylgeranyl diphosphate synthase type I
MNEPAVLTRSRDLVEPALRAAVSSLLPTLRVAAEYHFGWVEADGAAVADRRSGGKSIRPALVVLGAEAAGADATVAVPGAVAMELIHNFSLVHDDIMDGDRMRRHRPTVWDVYGVADGILVGDALHSLAYRVIVDADATAAPAALRLLADATSAMLAGQAQDTTLDRRNGGTLADCLAMERNKTASLFAGSVTLGGVLGGADATLLAALDTYGIELGMAFQAVDDVLGIWGDPAVTGKAVGNDLREHKKSLPVMVAIEAGGALAERLRSAFDGDVDDDLVAELSAAMADAGVRQDVDARVRLHLERALDALEGVAIPPAVGAELEALARFVAHRTH